MVQALVNNALVILSDQTVNDIHNAYQKVILQKKEVAFNLFTLSSYNNQLENFHSDVIAALLDPKGLHNRNKAFLFYFNRYLKTHFGADIEHNNYRNSEVVREKGLLDIWVYDNTSKHCIIIENKINNATDQENQIDNYANYAKSKGYKIDAIVYLSLDGNSIAPTNILSSITYNIGAFTDNKTDLIGGWLEPSIITKWLDFDSSTLVNQYIKLLKHIGNNNMDTEVMNKLYSFLSTDNGIEKLNTLNHLNNNMPAFRANNFVQAFKNNHAPFNKIFKYQPNWKLLQNLRFKDSDYKLGVQFNIDGSVKLTFSSVGGVDILLDILKAITLDTEFKLSDVHERCYNKHFNIGEGYASMIEVDDALNKFVENFLSRFDEHITQNK